MKGGKSGWVRCWQRYTPGNALPCPSLQSPALPYAALPYPALPYTVLPCPVLPCPTLPYTVLPCPALHSPILPPSILYCICLDLSLPSPTSCYPITPLATVSCTAILASRYTEKLLAASACCLLTGLPIQLIYPKLESSTQSASSAFDSNP